MAELRSGDLAVALREGAVGAVTVGGVEVLRALTCPVRNADWGTDLTRTTEEARTEEAVTSAVDEPQDDGEAVEDGVAAVAAPSLEAPALDIDALHREAINAYRSQDLDRAIDLWNQILAVDPAHESARLYRSQAEALKERLQRLR